MDSISARVTPCVGVWIETLKRAYRNLTEGHTLRGCVDWNVRRLAILRSLKSHPAWVCGLKLTKPLNTLADKMSHPAWVCGLKLLSEVYWHWDLWSHPAWVCGLKLEWCCQKDRWFSHTLRGCVDWNITWTRIIHYRCHTLRGCVDWNWTLSYANIINTSHTLRGCVDWNQSIDGHLYQGIVTPCVGVWIETNQ